MPYDGVRALRAAVRATAARPWWLGRDVLLVGAGDLAALYARALAPLGVTPRTLPADAAALAGLAQARALSKGPR